MIAALWVGAALAAPPVDLSLPGAPPSWRDPLPARETITLAAMGDVIPHERVVRRARAQAREDDAVSGWLDLLRDLAAPLSDADLAFANLESPVAPRTGHGRRPYVFDAPPALPRALAALGVDVVATANNHAWDQGIAGAGETVRQVRAAGLVPIGSGETCADAWTPALTRVGPLRVGWVGLTRILNRHAIPDRVDPGGPCVAWWSRRDDARVAALLDALRPQVDLLVVSLHAGAEYVPEPDTRDRAAIGLLVAHGADVVLGHHPHVLRPIEVLARPGGDVVIAHSLGNALSNQGWAWRPGDPADEGDVRDGVVLRLTLAVTPGLPGGGLVDLQAVPLWTDNDARSARDPDTPLRVRVGDDVPVARRVRIAEALGR